MILPTPPPVDARIFQSVLDRMPDPAGQAETAALEEELEAAFGVAHAVAVSSGTAALHTALAACGIGAGDEVLLPAITVMMTVAAVAEAGAHPVFVDAAPGGGMDLADLQTKITLCTRAILPVHLHGRCGGIGELAVLARRHDLMLIEDTCQAQGSLYRGRPAGTFGEVGCFSLKDGKIYAAGEGGYLLTDNAAIAERAAAYRTHWAVGAPGMPAGSRLGRNYRLPELSARLARHRLPGFPAELARRRAQAALLTVAVGDLPGLEVIAPGEQEEPNGYSPLWHIRLAEPRAFAQHLADAGVPNSVGTFGLRAASTHPACQALEPAPCPAAEHMVDHLLAVVLNTGDTEADLRARARIIQREALAWTVRTT
ncbi:aminotransferase class I/II-fold pyridoxal phosphate-dependent enzyme [Streptosporangium sp. NPDC051022]|uniref:DegT/DnrJ/EryC1/StrS family aminotransferase n=1 Tax=Streptosporangium sp. NPDC051022 TaxID=3155752 RepID=UPI003416255C